MHRRIGEGGCQCHCRGQTNYSHQLLGYVSRRRREAQFWRVLPVLPRRAISNSFHSFAGYTLATRQASSAAVRAADDE